MTSLYYEHISSLFFMTNVLVTGSCMHVRIGMKLEKDKENFSV